MENVYVKMRNDIEAYFKSKLKSVGVNKSSESILDITHNHKKCLSNLDKIYTKANCDLQKVNFEKNFLLFKKIKIENFFHA
jgi:hypothetical protein